MMGKDLFWGVDSRSTVKRFKKLLPTSELPFSPKFKDFHLTERLHVKNP